MPHALPRSSRRRFSSQATKDSIAAGRSHRNRMCITEEDDCGALKACKSILFARYGIVSLGAGAQIHCARFLFSWLGLGTRSIWQQSKVRPGTSRKDKEIIYGHPVR